MPPRDSYNRSDSVRVYTHQNYGHGFQVSTWFDGCACLSQNGCSEKFLLVSNEDRTRHDNRSAMMETTKRIFVCKYSISSRPGEAHSDAQKRVQSMYIFKFSSNTYSDFRFLKLWWCENSLHAEFGALYMEKDCRTRHPRHLHHFRWCLCPTAVATKRVFDSPCRREQPYGKTQERAHKHDATKSYDIQ